MSSTLTVSTNTSDPKVEKKIRKAVEKALKKVRESDDKFHYTVDTSFSTNRLGGIGYGRRYIQPEE